MGEWVAGLSPNGSENKPAGIRPLVYGIGKGKAGIEGLSVLTTWLRSVLQIGSYRISEKAVILIKLAPTKVISLN
jgi:hypothetical protein